ncbi:protein of unknown function [Nitrosomonas sp. Nm51]|uniref:DUF4168 domain-containing protein n=1 Tax=Nitrosomonas sp. Nm51 TaxID=133720 RepID=UPI0008CD8CE5|nr:DUF4168 domain-containing protein [Nitrosomonas sp. Nm51]SEQ78181.1 protein of unknown function [Nitrosomonas sp. Nm51]
MHNRWINSIVTACLLSILCSIPAMAQNQGNSEAAEITYTNEELKSFLIANAGLYQLQQQAVSQMQNTETDQQKQEVMQSINQQMLQVLQQAGLTADEYNSMGQTIQSDVQLQEKVHTIASELFQQEEHQ